MNSAPAADTPPSPIPPPSWWPWRSATVGWSAAALFLVAGVPPFLRMPLWIDATLYDVAARNILRGGTHYKDVFDTNPPGFVWSLCLIRPVLGPSMEALRAVDLALVVTVAWLVLRWARAGGATRGGVALAAAGMAAFYLFVSEFNHCQRDVWMMLPALAGASYRLARVRRATAGPVTDGWVFRTAVLEGVVWGFGAWLKPHVVPVAAVTWLVVQGRLVGSAPRRGWGAVRRPLADLAGAIAGGLLVGGCGLAWLVLSGTWDHFYDVFTNWNTSYLGRILNSLGERLLEQPGYFPPWSLLVFLAVPVAALNLLDARVWAAGREEPTAFGPVGRRLPGWLYDRAAGDDVRFARAVLAAVYLGWLGQAVVLQKAFHYAHVPETLLMLALFAANRWAVVVPALVLQAAVIGWPAVVSEERPESRLPKSVLPYLVWERPDREANRFKWWTQCFDREVPGEVRNGVAFQSEHFAGIDWVELKEVEHFLRTQDVRSGEVMCWNDSTHPLYLTLDHRPPIRFMHLSTATEMGKGQYEWVKCEVTKASGAGRTPRVRFVVSDMIRAVALYPGPERTRRRECGTLPDRLPPVITAADRTVFPLNQPTVFRSGGNHGRYVVHALANYPIGEVTDIKWHEVE